jgi:hypothetical protein
MEFVRTSASSVAICVPWEVGLSSIVVRMKGHDNSCLGMGYKQVNEVLVGGGGGEKCCNLVILPLTLH